LFVLDDVSQQLALLQAEARSDGFYVVRYHVFMACAWKIPVTSKLVEWAVVDVLGMGRPEYSGLKRPAMRSFAVAAV